MGEKKRNDGETNETSLFARQQQAGRPVGFSRERAEEKEDQLLEGEPEGYAFRFSP